MARRPLRFFLRRLLAAASFGLLSAGFADTAAAQFEGRFERFIERLDTDGNKVLDASELAQIQGPFRGMLESSGLDLSRSISTDELSERIRRRSEQRDSERGRDSGGRGKDEGSGAASGNSRSAPVTARPKSLIKREKRLVALPAQYTAGDTDHDGQLALSEWKTWKGRAALAEFARLDSDGDGFLTPRELVATPKTQAPAAAVATAGGAASAPGSTTPATSADQSTKAATEAKPAEPSLGEAAARKAEADEPLPAELDDPVGGSDPQASTAPAEPTGETADAARRYFDILDQDRDGKVGPKEWNASNRIRGLFTTAKLDLTQPMPRSDFIANYIRVSP